MIKIVGLGPGSPDALTIGAVRALEESKNLYFRTEKHPTVDYLKNRLEDFKTCDNYYEEGSSFDEVYSNIANEMIEEYQNGCEIVYGVRSKRDTDTVFKRATAQGFYKFLKWMGVETVYNHADYRLVSNRVLKEFKNFKEVNIFLRGMFPLVGFKSTSVFYERNERIAGDSHYPLSKMLALAIDGITSLSIKPIRLITSLGMFVSIISFIGVIWTLIVHFIGNGVAGWASMTSIICFLGGVQLISVGILGEYIGKIYMEVKARPRYIISETTEEDK